MAKQKKANQSVTLTGKCIQCGKTQVLTEQQITDAKVNGAALSTCCFFPMTIEKATVKIK